MATRCCGASHSAPALGRSSGPAQREEVPHGPRPGGAAQLLVVEAPESARRAGERRGWSADARPSGYRTASAAAGAAPAAAASADGV